MSSGWRDVTTADLELVLSAAAPAVAFPDAPDIASATIARLRQSPVRRPSSVSRRIASWFQPGAVLRPVFQPVWPRVAVAAVLVTVIFSSTLVFSPTARHAVAGWLGLRGEKITVVNTPPPTTPLALGAGLNLGEEVTLAEARAAVPFDILVPTPPPLGLPDEVYLREGNIADQVTLLYRERAGLPKAAFTGAGLLITEFRARIDTEFVLNKLIYMGTAVEPVTVNGERGFWISGEPHEIAYVDHDRSQVFDRVRLSGNVLVWEHGDVTIRLEADISKEEALRIAASVR
jgi:Domain of unknown function (DUF4367)